MLNQMPNTQQLPAGFIPMSPEEWLVNQGKMLPTNPDETTADDRVSMVMRFKQEAETSAVRQKAVQMWREADRLMEGRHWSINEDKLSDYQIGFVVNKVFSVCEKLVSLLISNIPEIEIVPRMSSMDALAEGLDNYFRHEYDRNNWIVAIGIALKQAVAHRTAFLKVFWDTSGDSGRGEVRVDPVSNYDLFIHDGAMIKDGRLEAKYIIHRMDKTRNEVIGKYGVDPTGEYQRRHLNQETGQKRPSNVNNFIDGMREEMILGQGGSSAGKTDSSRPPNYEERKETYEVYECHYKDDQLITSDGYDERQKRRLKYPTGRMITVCNSQLCHDGANPNGFCAFVPLTTDPNLGMIYGPSVVSHIAGVQFAVNKGYSQIFEHTERCCNPTMQISSLTQGITQDSNLRKPGSRIVTHEGRDGVGWIEPPRLGPEVMQLISISMEAIEDISGVYEVSQGETSSDARSGVAIEKLQTAAATRSNLRMTFVDEGIKVLVRNVCSLFLDNVKEERQYMFLDEDTMHEKFGTFDPQVQIIPTREAKVQALQTQLERSMYEMSIVERQEPAKAAEIAPMVRMELQALEQKIYETWTMPAHDLVSIDVRIQVGTRFMSKQQFQNMAMVLYELQLLTPQALFKILDWPGWRDNLRMLMEQQSQATAAEEEAIQHQFNLERTMKEVEHANAMELEQLEGALEIAKERIRLQAAEKKQAQAA